MLLTKLDFGIEIPIMIVFDQVFLELNLGVFCFVVLLFLLKSNFDEAVRREISSVSDTDEIPLYL